MYLIPKNIKVKREIFRGIGIKELIALLISIGIGYFFKSFVRTIKVKIFIFALFPMLTFLLILPLPNGSTVFNILKKFIIFKIKQKNFKYR